MSPGVPLRIASALLGVLVAGLAQARTFNWADDPAAKDPRYAASRAICRGLKDVAVPAADAPTPAEAASLADCSSEALYYGIGRPADPKAARLCAFVEKRNADPQVTNYGFTGDRILMTVYANGVGAPRNLDLATALACRSEAAPAEVDGRVKDLAGKKAANWTGTDFSLCDAAAGRLMFGLCAGHDQLIARANAAQAFAALSANWSAADRAAFGPLRRAEAGFADAHAQNEVDGSGALSAFDGVGAEQKVDADFAALLADAEAGRVAAATPAEADAADAARDTAYRDLMARASELSRGSTLKPAGFASAQRAWQRYRDAWGSFVKVRYPGLSPAAVAARLSRERAAQLAAVPERGSSPKAP